MSYEQIPLDLTRPAAPRPRTPVLPPLPETVPSGRARRREFDALAALCVCPLCAHTFADEQALLAHRPSGRCLPPAQAGLIRHDQPQPCWARKETR